MDFSVTVPSERAGCETGAASASTPSWAYTAPASSRVTMTAYRNFCIGSSPLLILIRSSEKLPCLRAGAEFKQGAGRAKAVRDVALQPGEERSTLNEFPKNLV